MAPGHPGAARCEAAARGSPSCTWWPPSARALVQPWTRFRTAARNPFQCGAHRNGGSSPHESMAFAYNFPCITNARTGSCCHSNRSRRSPASSRSPTHLGGSGGGSWPGELAPFAAACSPPRIASSPALQLPPHADRTRVYFQVPSGESASEQHSGLLSSQESHNLPFSFCVPLRPSPFLPSALGRVSRWLEFARPGRPARAAAASLRGSLLPAPGCAQGSPFCANRILRSGSIVIVSRSL